MTPFALSVELGRGASDEHSADKQNHDGQRQAADQSSASVNEKEKRRAAVAQEGTVYEEPVGRGRRRLASSQQLFRRPALSQSERYLGDATRFLSIDDFFRFPAHLALHRWRHQSVVIVPIFAPNAPSHDWPDAAPHVAVVALTLPAPMNPSGAGHICSVHVRRERPSLFNV